MEDNENSFSNPENIQDNFKMPSVEDLLEALDRMDLSEENKQQLRESILARGNPEKSDFLNNFKTPDVASSSIAPDIMILFLLITIILLIFGKTYNYNYRNQVEKPRDMKKFLCTNFLMKQKYYLRFS